MPHHKSYDTHTIRTNLAKYSHIFIILQETMLIGDLMAQECYYKLWSVEINRVV